MYLQKTGHNGFGSTGWRLTDHTPHDGNQMAEANFSIGIMTDIDGLHIAGEKNVITWAELEEAKVNAQKKQG